MEERLNPLSGPPGTLSPGAGGAGEALDVRGSSFARCALVAATTLLEFLWFSVEFTPSVGMKLSRTSPESSAAPQKQPKESAFTSFGTSKC